MLGPERILFAADHPYEDAKPAVDFLRSTPLDEGVRAAIAHRNAERLFGLPPRS